MPLRVAATHQRASNNFTYCVAENGILSSYENIPVRFRRQVKTGSRRQITSYFTIVMSCVVQFCICDLVQHKIE